MNKIIRFRNWLAGERAAVDATAITLADNITAIFQIIGMLLLPAVPASLVFLAIILSFAGEKATVATAMSTATTVALVLAAIAAVGLEAVGVVSCKTAMRLYRGYRRKYVQISELITGAIAAVFYGVLVGLALFFTENLPGMAGTMGWISPALAMVLYMMTGFNLDLQSREDERADLMAHEQAQQRQLDQEKLNLELNTLRLQAELAAQKQKMALEQEMAAFKAKLDLKTKKEMARLEAKLAQTGPRRSPQVLLAEAQRIYEEYNGQISGPEMADLLQVELRTAQNYIQRVKNLNGRK